MEVVQVAIRIQLRRDLSSTWTSVSPVLRAGEIGIETDSLKFKIGDGSSTWSNRPYVNVLPSELTELSQDAVNQALTAGNGITKVYDDSANTITVSVDTSVIANKQYVDDSLAAVLDTAPELLNTLNELAAAIGDDPNFFATVAANLASHEADTTNVHGIADTSILITTTGTQTLSNKTLVSPALTGVPTAPTAAVGTNTTQIATTEFVKTAVDNLIDGAPGVLDTLNEIAAAVNDDPAFFTNVATNLANHEADTTNIHGIANTSKLITDDGTQTLTNKTLTSPAINTATFKDGVVRGLEEDVNVVASAATGTINFDVDTASVWYYTSNATANHTLNFRYSSSVSLNTALAVGDAITLVWLNTNGATAYYPNVIQIDGTTVTPKVPAAISAGNASAIDAYSFTIIKTASATFTILASQTKFA